MWSQWSAAANAGPGPSASKQKISSVGVQLGRQQWPGRAPSSPQGPSTAVHRAGDAVDRGDVHRAAVEVVGDVARGGVHRVVRAQRGDRDLVVLADRGDQDQRPRVDQPLLEVPELERVRELDVLPVDRHRGRARGGRSSRRPCGRGTCRSSARPRPGPPRRTRRRGCAGRCPARRLPLAQTIRARSRRSRRGSRARPCRRRRRRPRSRPSWRRRCPAARVASSSAGVMPRPKSDSSRAIAASAQTPSSPMS